MADEKQSSEKRVLDADMILDLNFVPQWARKPASEVSIERFKDADDEGRGQQRGDRRSGRDGDYGRGRGGHRDRDNRRERRPSSRDGERRGERHIGREGERRQRRDWQPAPLPPVAVRFLPEQKALVGLMRQVAGTKRAYPLVDLAALLMSKPGFCFVKLEVEPGVDDVFLYQCKLCRTVSLARGEIEQHIISDHLEDFFEIEEVEGEPPSGSFVCVAKCGLSGTLLGPPNHHSYADAVKRVYQTRFAHMDFDDYKSRIKVSHEPEDVERWKTEAAKTLRCSLKGGGDDAAVMDWAAAQRYMREKVVEANLIRGRKVAISEDVAHKLRDRGLKRVLRIEWQKESRFPLRLSFALRAAFKHKGMYVFKAGEGKGMNFVTAVQPTPIDAEHAIPAIHDMITYLRENPGCTKAQIVEALRPGCDVDSEEAKELLQPLHWLVDRGHIIEFFNGTFSVPLGGRKVR